MNVRGEWEVVGVGGDREMESGLDVGSVVVLEEGWRVGDVLGFKTAFSGGVLEVSLAGDVEGDVRAGLLNVGAVEVDFGVGGDAVDGHIEVGKEKGGVIG